MELNVSIRKSFNDFVKRHFEFAEIEYDVEAVRSLASFDGALAIVELDIKLSFDTSQDGRHESLVIGDRLTKSYDSFIYLAIDSLRCFNERLDLSSESFSDVEGLTTLYRRDH
jgi:hypothetical protein